MVGSHFLAVAALPLPVVVGMVLLTLAGPTNYPPAFILLLARQISPPYFPVDVNVVVVLSKVKVGLANDLSIGLGVGFDVVAKAVLEVA